MSNVPDARGERLQLMLSPDHEDSRPAPHESLLGPACRLCNGMTRLTGIEPHPRDDHVDIRSFECSTCGHPFAVDVPLQHVNGK